MNFETFKNHYQHKPVKEYPNQVPEKTVVSAFVITYNHVNYIKDCLDGILMQKTDFPFEILLGDDDSTDGTRQICLEYAKKYPEKIRLFLHNRENNIKINGNPTGKFNFVYNFYAARGEYIALCEGDDFWTDPLKLQKQVYFLENNKDCSLCYHSTKLIYADNSRPNRNLKPRHASDVRKFTLKEYIGRGGLGIATAAMVVRANTLSEFPQWYFLVPFGDLPVKLLCGLNGMIGYIPEIMATYRKAVPGSWSQNHKRPEWIIKHMNDRVYVNNLFNEYTQFKYDDLIKAANVRWRQRRLRQLMNCCSRAKIVKLIGNNEISFTGLGVKSTTLVSLRFIFGERLYIQILKLYGRLKYLTNKKINTKVNNFFKEFSYK